MFLLTIAVNGFIKGFKSQVYQWWCQCNVLFRTEQLMWQVLKGPEGPKPRHLLSKQLSQSGTSQLQLQL